MAALDWPPRLVAEAGDGLARRGAGAVSDADCTHDTCLMERALHDAGRCTARDHIVLGVYCPLLVCRLYGVGAMLRTYREAMT